MAPEITVPTSYSRGNHRPCSLESMNCQQAIRNVPEIKKLNVENVRESYRLQGYFLTSPRSWQRAYRSNHCFYVCFVHLLSVPPCEQRSEHRCWQKCVEIPILVSRIQTPTTSNNDRLLPEDWPRENAPNSRRVISRTKTNPGELTSPPNAPQTNLPLQGSSERLCDGDGGEVLYQKYSVVEFESHWRNEIRF